MAGMSSVRAGTISSGIDSPQMVRTRMKKPLEVLSIYAAHNYTLNGAFQSRAARDPERPFIRYNGRTQSWRAFGDLVHKTACLLTARGVKHGDRVAVMARNCDGHVLMLLALARIGAVMVPIVAAIFVMGIFPNIFLSKMDASIKAFLTQVKV